MRSVEELITILGELEVEYRPTPKKFATKTVNRSLRAGPKKSTALHQCCSECRSQTMTMTVNIIRTRTVTEFIVRYGVAKGRYALPVGLRTARMYRPYVRVVHIGLKS